MTWKTITVTQVSATASAFVYMEYICDPRYTRQFYMGDLVSLNVSGYPVHATTQPSSTIIGVVARPQTPRFDPAWVKTYEAALEQARAT